MGRSAEVIGDGQRAQSSDPVSVEVRWRLWQQERVSLAALAPLPWEVGFAGLVFGDRSKPWNLFGAASSSPLTGAGPSIAL
eukprot:913954-Amphidinium_carterae.1